MKKLAGYGIIAGLVGAALGGFFLLGGTWSSLLGLGVIIGVIALFAGGLVLVGELWDRGHRWLSVLFGVMLMGVIPGVILQWAVGAWWLMLALAGMALGVFAVLAGVCLIVKYAIGLIEGEM